MYYTGKANKCFQWQGVFHLIYYLVLFFKNILRVWYVGVECILSHMRQLKNYIQMYDISYDGPHNSQFFESVKGTLNWFVIFQKS